jgi:hypothetical protein
MSDRELEFYEKDPNLVISLIDYYLKQLEILPQELVIYLDNCGGQNKNNYVLWYLHYLA